MREYGPQLATAESARELAALLRRVLSLQWFVTKHTYRRCDLTVLRTGRLT
jgi:hypothetical protein